MKKIGIFILLALTLNFVEGQQLINNNWFYGYGAGLNFNTSPPTSFAGITSVSNEASNAVSNRNNGNLLYYTNSDTVYDATHTPMANGMNLIGGGHSSYQGVISVPDPGDTNRYYMFSVGDAQYGGAPPTPANWLPPYGGFAYHIIDMSLNFGNGDVAVRDQVIKQVNDTSAGKWYEQRITAAPHCNGVDYWVIVRREDSLATNSNLYAYLVTAAGVQNPIISNGGISKKGFGGMKFAPDASRLAFIGSKIPPFTGNFDPIKLEVFDFDNSTGVFTTFANYDAGTLINVGLSFSPNSQFVYFSGGGFTSINGTYQIDLNNPNPATNMVQISTSTPNALQLARDGKIYAPAGGNSANVNAILNPNVLGIGANFTANVVTLATGSAWTGICNVMDAFPTAACPTVSCIGNIVPNPSFEDTLFCPTGNGQMTACQDWDKPVTGGPATGTSDYYNLCGNYSIPSNTGNAYAGFISYINFFANAREYIQVQLDTTLVAGQCYEASMYVALESGSGYTHDSVGMLFTNLAPPSPGGSMITATPQVANTVATTVIDSNWVQITGTFVAQGGENFLTIGVFTADVNLTITPTGSPGLGAKYMIDDVCLFAIPNDTIVASLIPDTTDCNGLPVTLNAPAGYSSYVWTTIAGAPVSTTDSFNTTFMGTTQYILYATDTTVCPTQVNIDTVNVIALNCGLSVTPNVTLCLGDSILLTATGSTTGYTWADSLALATVLQNPDSFYMASPIVTTTYAVYNLADTVYTTVTIAPTSSSNTILTECAGYSITINSNTYTTTGVYIDTIISGNQFGCDSIVTTDLTIIPVATTSQSFTECTGFSITVNSNTYTTTGIYTDTIIAGAANGCDSIVTTNLTIVPISTSTTNLVECTGFSITVNGNTYNTTGIYIDTLIAGAVSGCDSIITTNLTIVQPGNAGADTTSSFCSGNGTMDLFTLLGAADVGGVWSPALSSGTGIFDPLVDLAGSYNYIITNVPCLPDTASVTVIINPSPTVNITTVDDNCEQAIGAISLNTTSGTPPFTFNWSTGSTDSSIANLGLGIYTVIVGDSNGCTNSYNVSVEDFELDCEYHIYLPNVFSPNGDNENDILFVRGEGIETVKLIIYNRWGNKVFESTDITQGWDGTYRGQEQGSAVFVYYIEATFVNGATAKEKGNVSIVK